MISGGDFFNGFRYGAISAAFNHVTHVLIEGGDKTPLPDGRKLWELSSEEFALFANAETRSQVTGCECDIQLSIAEQMYLIGKALWLINPTAKLPTVVAKSSVVALGNTIKNVDDVMANPSLLQGKTLSEIQLVLKNSPGWKEGVMTKTRSLDKGWTLHQLNSKGTNVTDLYIQYHPGTLRHFNGSPYWKVSSGKLGVQWFQAGN